VAAAAVVAMLAATIAIIKRLPRPIGRVYAKNLRRRVSPRRGLLLPYDPRNT